MCENISHDYNVSAEQRKRELAIAKRVQAQNKFNVLDICCRRFPRGFGIDLHPESNADVICDAHKLKPIESKAFDLTLCVEGIEHLANPTQAVQEWARVTKYALAITTQNAHCWRRWLRFPPWKTRKLCTSPDHIYLWDEFTFRNFFRKALPDALVKMEWYDRYLKKTRWLKPSKFFRENIFAFVWLGEYNLSTMDLYYEVFMEAKRLINFRPEGDREFSGRPSDKTIRGIDT